MGPPQVVRGPSLNELSQRHTDTKLTSSTKGLTDFCYSISNLVLIAASLVALVFALKFLTDDSLYEYGEHLLSFRFYHQLVFVMVLLPLVLLVPVVNAIGALAVARRPTRGYLGIKLAYQGLMVLLFLLALFFLAPSMSQSSLTIRLDEEIRLHMSRRYESSFSYDFIDRLQTEFRCCDEFWYNSHQPVALPASCLVPDGGYDRVWPDRCSFILAGMVSWRCLWLVLAITAIVGALMSLIAIDLVELVSNKRYQFSRELTSSIVSGSSNRPERVQMAASLAKPEPELEFREDDPDDYIARNGLSSSNIAHLDDSSDEAEANNRGHHQRISKTTVPSRAAFSRDHNAAGNASTDVRQPLLGSATSGTDPSTSGRRKGQFSERIHLDDDTNSIQSRCKTNILPSDNDAVEKGLNDDRHDHQRGISTSGRPSPTSPIGPMLTKFNYLPVDRAQSPLFLATSASSLVAGVESSQSRREPSSPRATTPTKSALKKSLSNLRIDEANDQDNSDKLREYQHRLARELQSRRSMLNVRFAE